MMSTDQVETYEDGEVIFRQGDESREMYVIQRGEVVVLREVNNGEVELKRLKRGEFFGEMSLLESVPRSATVRAVGETRLLVIRPGALMLKIRRNPSFTFDLLKHMSSRIRELTDRFVEQVSATDDDGEVWSEGYKQARAASASDKPSSEET